MLLGAGCGLPDAPPFDPLFLHFILFSTGLWLSPSSCAMTSIFARACCMAYALTNKSVACAVGRICNGVFGLARKLLDASFG